MRARVPRSWSNDSSARSSVTLLTYTDDVPLVPPQADAQVDDVVGRQLGIVGERGWPSAARRSCWRRTNSRSSVPEILVADLREARADVLVGAGDDTPARRA